MELLYLNDIKVDLPQRSVALTSQINDIAELKDRQVGYSNNVKLPFTSKNIQVMEMLGIAGNNTRIPYENLKVKYVLNGIELISNGFGIVKNTGTFYNLIIYSSAKDVFSEIANLTLADLDYTAYNHNLNVQVFEDSHANTSGYIYPLANYVGLTGDTIFVLETFSPAFYIHTLFEMIFAQAGFTISGDFLTDSDYKSRVMTMADGVDREKNDSKISVDSDNRKIGSGSAPYTLGSDLITNGSFTTDTNWNKTTGVTISGGTLNFNDVVFFNGANQTGVTTIGKTYRVEITVSNYVKGSIRITLGNLYTEPFSQLITANGTYTIDVKAYLSSSFYIVSGDIDGTTLSVDNVSAKEIIQDPTINETFASVVTTKRYLMQSYTAVTKGTYWFKGIGDLTVEYGQIVNVTIAINGVFYDIPYEPYFAGEADYATYFSIEIGDLLEFYIKATSVSNGGTETIKIYTDYVNDFYIVNEYSVVNFEAEIGSTSQKDFVKEIMQRFGLVMDRVKNSNEYRFTTMKDLLTDEANAEDWSNKYSDFLNEDYKPNYGKQNDFKFKYDKNENDIVETFADGCFNLNNKNLPELKTIVTSIFRASNTYQTYTDPTTGEFFIYGEALYLKHWKVDDSDAEQGRTFEALKDKIRIFKMVDKTRDIQVKSLWDIGVINHYTDSRPYLDFTDVDYQYEIDNYYTEITAMLDNYHKIRLKLNLSVVDHYNLDFFKLKYFKQLGKYFYLNKVSNFKPNQKTTVELIQI